MHEDFRLKKRSKLYGIINITSTIEVIFFFRNSSVYILELLLSLNIDTSIYLLFQ